MKANEFITAVSQLTEKSKSKDQSQTMTAACKSADFRKKVDIPKDVACDFHKADKGTYHESSDEGEDVDKSELQAELEKYKNMSPREKRETYKPFGRLGSMTKPEQVLYHKVHGSNKHDWAFKSQYPNYVEQKCRICGRTRYIDSKGRPFAR